MLHIGYLREKYTPNTFLYQFGHHCLYFFFFFFFSRHYNPWWVWPASTAYTASAKCCVSIRTYLADKTSFRLKGDRRKDSG